MNEDEIQVLNKVKAAIETYHSIANMLRYFITITGTIGISAALYVTAFAGFNIQQSNHFLDIRSASFVSALCLTILTAFNVTAKGNNARNAFRYLDHAYMLFQIRKYTLEDLVNAKNNAEKILGSVDFQTSINEKP